MIDTLEIDPPSCILEVAEFFGYYEQPVPKNIDMVAQRALQMSSLQNSFGREGGLRNGRERTIGHVEQGDSACDIDTRVRCRSEEGTTRSAI
jgi:hypothetical protein